MNTEAGAVGKWAGVSIFPRPELTALRIESFDPRGQTTCGTSVREQRVEVIDAKSGTHRPEGA